MRVLFVCMGNICRSPTAEGVFREHARRHAPGLDIEIDSAGTHDYHVGEPPDPRTIEAGASTSRACGHDKCMTTISSAST
jgi:protein-tyrosine phosphatase